MPRIDPEVEKQVLGPQNEDPRRYRGRNLRQALPEDRYRCPYCFEITASLREGSTVRCKKCGKDYFKSASMVEDSELLSQEEPE